MHIGERIKEFRLKCGLSQEDVAKAINSTKQAVYKYENGIVTNIPSDKIEIMAKLFNTTPCILMGWTDQEEDYGFLQLFASETPTYTEHEQNIIQAYRSQPEIQPAVDRLLGIEESNKNTVYTVYNAANHPDNHEAIIKMDAERWDQMEDTPKTDDDLQ